MLLTPKKNRRHPTAVRKRRDAGRRKADVRRNAFRVKERRTLTLKHWLAVLVLAPVALITTLTMMEMFWRLLSRHALWRAEEVQFFVIGLLAWGLIYGVAKIRPVRLYVFGHELSHALATLALGGKVYRFEFNAQGGFVETDKTNTFISLAPYFLPIYAFAVMLGFGVLALFMDLDGGQSIRLMGTEIPLKLTRLLYIGLGLSWAFHATYTALTLRSEQSDLTRNGEFFSLMLIFLVNAGLLTLMIVAASPRPELGFAQTVRCWWGVAGGLTDWLVDCVFFLFG